MMFFFFCMYKVFCHFSGERSGNYDTYVVTTYLYICITKKKETFQDKPDMYIRYVHTICAYIRYVRVCTYGVQY